MPQMNRKQRRAALKQRPSAGAAAPSIAQLFEDALRLQHQNKLDDAAAAYKRLLLLKPDHAEASNNLGVVLLAQSKLAEASAYFARSLKLTPQLFDQFHPICATLISVLPPVNEAMRRAVAAWPKRLPVDELLGNSALNAIAANPLLLCVLQWTSVREVALERLLTSLRMSLLNDAITGASGKEVLLAFCCALAKQCFINEYVFDTTDAEIAQLDQLKASLARALELDAVVPAMSLAALAMYEPLHNLPWTQSLLDRVWPASFDELVTQQVREVLQERELRASVPRLTPVEDEVSQLVQQQYEENPYPRWVDVSTRIDAVTLDQHLRDLFQTAAFTPLGKTDGAEILVAGCGTGRHCIWIAQRFQGAHLLAVDLSLSSICFAKRKTPAALADRITYGQADILKLSDIGRTFDVIDASGVLHHMADPFGGWRILLKLLRPGGFMHVCLYSGLGREDIAAARTWIAERGLAPSPANIRRCRQELLETPLRSITRFNDYFSMSECRDLLFHVQESHTTIPAIKAFLAENKLKFIGFAFDRGGLKKYRTLFSENHWSISDLDRWHAVESEYPDTFSGMYQIWVQKG
jgi:2-polyprenyl-3-methyl-5-hydroxy-6-metoxy-1,4-benzoquinol methylase/tetratricopeptide (TPR) repeat protein